MEKYDWDIEEVRRLRKLKFPWVAIAKDFGCHVNTLLGWRNRVNYVDDHLVGINDEELDALVLKVLDGKTHEGQIQLWARLEGLGYSVTRQRVRDCIDRVQPAAAAGVWCSANWCSASC